MTDAAINMHWSIRQGDGDVELIIGEKRGAPVCILGLSPSAARTLASALLNTAADALNDTPPAEGD